MCAPRIHRMRSERDRHITVPLRGSSGVVALYACRAAATDPVQANTGQSFDMPLRGSDKKVSLVMDPSS